MGTEDWIGLFGLLDSQKHWAIKTINRDGRRRAYEATVWGNGRRRSAQAPTPIDAVRRALAKVYSGQLKVISDNGGA